MIYNLLKTLYRFKYTIAYSVAFFFLGGAVLAIPAFIGGILVDAVFYKAKINSKSYPLSYWFLYVLLVAILYPTIVFSAIAPDTSNGFVYSWINVTAEFTDKMADIVPAIDIYAKQIAGFGDSWRVPKFRHLYAVFWFTNIIMAPLLYYVVPVAIRYIYKLDLKKFRPEKWKDDKDWIKKYNWSGIFLLIIFILISFVLPNIYFGGELKKITYLKGRYYWGPFVLLSYPVIIAVIVPGLIAVNLKRKRSRKDV